MDQTGNRKIHRDPTRRCHRQGPNPSLQWKGWRHSLDNHRPDYPTWLATHFTYVCMRLPLSCLLTSSQPAILNRSTRLSHPPVLTRGSRPLTYGTGVPAPWNSNPVPPLDANGVPPTPITTKAKDAVKGEDTKPPAIPDAILFPTWDYDTKDYRVPLSRHRTRVGSVNAGSGSGTITLPNLGRKGAKGS